MIRLVLCDVDGTLVPFGTPHVSDRTIRAIHELEACGIEFGLATGRDTQELATLMRGEAIKTGVISNGKKVLLDGKVVHMRCLDHEPMERLAAIARKTEGMFINAYPAETSPENYVYCIGADGEDVGYFSERWRFRPILTDEVPDLDVLGMTVACPGGEDVERLVQEEVAKEIPEFDFVRPTSLWLDVLPHGVRKATTLPLLLDAMHIGPSDVVFFGDGENDLEVMDAVPDSVAVADAMPRVRDAARWHVGACAEDGVAIALEDIVRAARRGTTPDFMSHEDAK